MSDKVCRTYVLEEDEEVSCNCCGFNLFSGDECYRAFDGDSVLNFCGDLCAQDSGYEVLLDDLDLE